MYRSTVTSKSGIYSLLMFSCREKYDRLQLTNDEDIILSFRAGHVQTADSSLLSASAFALPSLCLERAKWMASQVGTANRSPYQ